MRLLHAQSIQLRSFEENAIPPYSILSHTWGNDEVSFLDIQGPYSASKAGYRKIRLACQDALQRGLEHVWVDTCCIDKSSSAELLEAINSMFRWYENAKICYVYLEDVPDVTLAFSSRMSGTAFAESRWWSRGWTLQELLAPKEVLFFSRHGQLLGTKDGLSKHISDMTGIGEEFIVGKTEVMKASVAKRMSWASRRKTTRTEDLAYCLLGIFGINMALIYGEGSNAFRRLQEEIMKNSDDQSLFAWGYRKEDFSDFKSSSDHGPFATEPAAFCYSANFIPDELDECQTHYAVTNKGLDISLRVIHSFYFGVSRPFAVLACRPEAHLMWLVALPIKFYGAVKEGKFTVLEGNSFARFGDCECSIIHRDRAIHEPTQALRFQVRVTSFLEYAITDNPLLMRECCFVIRKLPRHDSGLHMWDAEPRETWDPEQRLLRLQDDGSNHAVIRLGREEGEGYAIAISMVPGIRCIVEVFKESRNRPIPYSVLNPNKESVRRDDDTLRYVLEESSDIKVTIGVETQVLGTSNGLCRTVDIEVAENSGKGSLTGQNDTIKE